MPRLRHLALAALALAALPATAQTDASVIPADAPHWLPMNEAVRAVRADSSILLVHLYAKWCGWCARLDRDVYSDDTVQAYLADHFVVTRVDIESDENVSFFGRDIPQAALAEAFQVTGTPTTVFFSPAGTYITKLPGFAPPEQFVEILRYVQERGYEMMPFPAWMEMRDGAPTLENAGG